MPRSLDITVLYAAALAEPAKYAYVQPIVAAASAPLEPNNKLSAQQWRPLLERLESTLSEVGNDAPHTLLSIALSASSGYLVLGDIERSNAIVERWQQRRESLGGIQAVLRWHIELLLPYWPSIRTIPNIERVLLARTRDWRGLGLQAGENHTPQSLEELEFVLFLLGGMEGRVFLLEDLRPRVLAAFPKGHPMRAICEARWSFTLRKFGRFQEARKVVDDAIAELTPNREFANRRLERTLLHEAGQVYVGLGEYARARDITRDLPAEFDANTSPGDPTRGYSWGQRAYVHAGLGEYDDAIDAWEKAAQTDPRNARMRMGALLLQLGRPTEGLPLLKAAEDYRNVGGGWGWMTASAIAEHYIATGNADMAARWLGGAKHAVAKLSPESVPETAYFFLLDSRIANVLGDQALRQQHLISALAMASNGRSQINYARVLFELGDYWAGRSNLSAAITVGKNAALRLQAFRLAAASGQRIEPAPTGLNFQRPLQRTVDRLIAAGRLPEAEQILAILQQERYYDFVRSPSRYSTQSNVSLNASERLFDQSLRQIETQSMALAEQNDLAWSGKQVALRQGQPEPMQTAREDLLAQAGRAVLLLDLQEVTRPTPTLNIGRTSLTAISTDVRARLLPARTARLTFFSLPNQYIAQLQTRRGVQEIRIEAEKEEIHRALQRFRQALARPDFASRASAEKLYSLLFSRIDRALRAQQIERLEISSADALRYLPYAALHDGRDYLVHRYTFVNVLSSADSIADLARQPASRHAAIFATSKFDSKELVAAGIDAAPLPAAINELQGVISALTSASGGPQRGAQKPTLAFAEFTHAQLRETMQNNPPTLLHLASHFLFSPGAAGRSRLLAADGYITLREMAAWDWRKIELVTFSACNSGLASFASAADAPQDIDGPHEMAIRAGAQNAISSLWMVSDASAAVFMPAMYSLSQAPGNWGERLAKTQRRFAAGDFGANYRHPHHWAAFTIHRKASQ